jgi:D-alanyl-D-alanine carboxypeptidase/D-alanyl-D-alanine-endopeptidase (penicillin-binding protein 4)
MTKARILGLSTQSQRVLIIGAAARLFKACVLSVALVSTPAAAAGLPKPVREALRASGIPPSSVGALVQEAGGRRISLALNAERPMNPASVMKLVTTYAALELLTPAYRWKTEAHLRGALGEDGVLEGDLVLRGSGDPKLNYESFWMLLRGLRGRGLREIRGDVVLDRSRFGPAAGEPIDNDAFRPYNVAPDALLVNFKSLRFVFVPEGERVRVFVEPNLPGLEVINGLRPGSGTCPEGRAFRDLIEAAFVSSPQPRAAFSGTYPAECGERELNVALYAPEDYVAGMIRQLWSEMGGSWSGTVRNGAVPEDARLAYVHESQPLGEIVRDVNKFSNNVMARQLYLTLAADLAGAPATTEKGAEVIRQWLLLRNLPAQGLVIENGSGLSRLERASASTLAALLQAAWRSPVMPEFVASLPLASVDGTMRKRLHGERVAGHAHIKTGLLSDVRSVAGYVLDRHGRRQVVVMLINHPNAPQADAAFDALLGWVYDGARGPARPKPRPPGASPPRP